MDPIYLINTAVHIDGDTKVLSYDYFTIDGGVVLVKYSNDTESFYLIEVFNPGTYFGTEFTTPGVYLYNYSKYDSSVNYDILINYIK